MLQISGYPVKKQKKNIWSIMSMTQMFTIKYLTCMLVKKCLENKYTQTLMYNAWV
jgi:hypothetical protein